jgi:capsular exopolysaccharide synthesis family protein
LDLYQSAGSVSAIRRDVRLRDLVDIARRRRKIIITTCAIFALLATVKCMLSTRRYEADAAIQIQKDESDALGLETSLGSSQSEPSDALDYNISLQTQARVLISDTLALAVIRDTHLEQNDDFTGVHAWFRLPGWLTPWSKPTHEADTLPLDEAPERRRRALKTFARRLKVQIEPGTRVINISFLSTDPRIASDVVNHLISEFTEYNYRTRSQATAQVSQWLQGQLDGISLQATDAQAKASQLAKEAGLFGNDEQHNVVLARLDQLNTGLVSAEENRIFAEAFDKVTATGDPEAIGMINAGGSSAFSSSTAASLSLVQQLRSRQSDLSASLRLSLAKYGENYPLVLEQQAQLQSIEQSLQDEISRMAQRAHNEYKISAIAETASRRSLDQQKSVVEKLKSHAMEYVVAKEDADSNRELLEDLKKKLADAKLLTGLRSSNVTIVDPGRPPSSDHPKQPDIPLTLASGCALGLIAGAVLAFIEDSRDSRIHSASQLEGLLGVPLLAILPSFKETRGWVQRLPQLQSRTKRLTSSNEFQAIAPIMAPLDSDSKYAEVLRSLRTSLLLSQSQRHPKVILITSAQSGEGKSTTALHLGTILGQQGGRVLIVDGDLRRATLHEKLDIPNEQGLSSLLSSADSAITLHSLVGLANVSVLTAGPRPPYPAELLGGLRMGILLTEWRSLFDFILIDTPPVLPVTDAVLLSYFADIILLVARHQVSTTHSVQNAYRRLAVNDDRHKVAVILNAVALNSTDLTDYYGYEHNYGIKPETRALHAS